MGITSIDQVDMKEVNLACPVESEDIKGLKLGDVVYLDGVIYTGREGLYKRMLDEGHDPPEPLRQISNVNFHCSPAATPTEEGQYLVKAVSATASFRFGRWMKRFFDQTRCRLIIGKGGMTSREYKDLFVPAGALYLTTVGYGLGSVYGQGVAGVHSVYWLEELGIAQAVWVLEINHLGPFIVESDMEGNSLFELCNKAINKNLSTFYEGLPEPILHRYGEVLDRKEEVL
jgi:L(+)-tartrate dehydratase beta subunit